LLTGNSFYNLDILEHRQMKNTISGWIGPDENFDFPTHWPPPQCSLMIIVNQTRNNFATRHVKITIESYEKEKTPKKV
jgi:hypothetical protein